MLGDCKVNVSLPTILKTSAIISNKLSPEQPSSSSMSTTTSSVTSMTSLEQSESASDYDPEHWDNMGWGEMESSTGEIYL